MGVLVALAGALATSVDTLLIAPPQREPASLVSELDIVFPELARLSEADQRRVAALLKTYIAVTTGQETDRVQGRCPAQGAPGGATKLDEELFVLAPQVPNDADE